MDEIYKVSVENTQTIGISIYVKVLSGGVFTIESDNRMHSLSSLLQPRSVYRTIEGYLLYRLVDLTIPTFKVFSF